MSRLVYFICEFVYTAVKIWLSFGIVSAVAKPKVEKKTEDVVLLVSTMVLSALNTYNDSVISVLFSNGMMLILVIGIALVAGIMYRYPFMTRTAMILMLWTGLALVDFFIQTLSYLLLLDFNKYVDPEILLTVGYARGVYMLLSAIVTFGAGKRLITWMKKVEISEYIKWIYCLLLPLVCVMVYFQKIYTLETPERLMNRWWIIILGGSLAILLFFAYVVRRREEEQMRLQQIKLDMLETNYLSLQHVYEEKAILLHDIKNHFQVIREMANDDQKEEMLSYIGQITGSMQLYRSRDLTNHKLMNLILNMKIQEAEESGIKVDYEFDDMSELKLDSMEICAILSNLLDNAIEANIKVNDVDRWLRISCIRKHSMFILTISNPIGVEAVIKSDQLPETTKKEKELHGFGMRSIKRIIDRYDGHMRIDTEDNVFLVTLFVSGF